METKRTFLMGDIHGMAGQFLACLKGVNFNYENDKLIQLGDVCDRGPNTYAVVEELLKMKHLVALRGNHDETFMESTITGRNVLYDQGGRETLLSYTRETNCDGDPCKIPNSHQLFFRNQLPYYIDENRNLFIHGGFNRHELLEKQQEHVFYWDRDLFLAALSYKIMKNNNHKFKIKENFNHIYIGHTPTTYWDKKKPITVANITNLDTGCGKNGLLTIMNLDTKEIFQA